MNGEKRTHYWIDDSSGELRIKSKSGVINNSLLIFDNTEPYSYMGRAVEIRKSCFSEGAAIDRYIESRKEYLKNCEERVEAVKGQLERAHKLKETL